jgi:hypothetical protein
MGDRLVVAQVIVVDWGGCEHCLVMMCEVYRAAATSHREVALRMVARGESCFVGCLDVEQLEVVLRMYLSKGCLREGYLQSLKLLQLVKVLGVLMADMIDWNVYVVCVVLPNSRS